MLPLSWLVPRNPTTSGKNTQDDNIKNVDEKIYSTFLDLQRKTKETLYVSETKIGSDTKSIPVTFVDRSPKGSVDGPIQDLVDLINHHSSISTLSSCSGRISLFDPNSSHQTHERLSQDRGTENPKEDELPFTEASGKGRGRWVVVTHHVLDPQEMIGALFPKQPPSEMAEEMQPWTLKFEPMLLHVAADSLMMGQALLQVALECGFRESGLVVTSKRVTVAIRSHSLTLSLPILPQTSPRHPLCPTPEYVTAVVQECNRRMYANWNHLHRLYESIEGKWFQVQLERPVAKLRSLPPLQLWNAATISWSTKSKTGSKAATIFTFGGYGKGPQQNGTTPLKGSKRTSGIFRLDRSEKGDWALQWESIRPPNNPIHPVSALQEAVRGISQIERISSLPTCQGMAAANLGPWIVLWGGRTSPAKPLDASRLHLFDPVSLELSCVTITTGVIPEGRWGHTLVPLSNNRVAMVGGTRLNTEESQSSTAGTAPALMEDCYILHCTNDRGFFWEKLESLQFPGGRTHAGVTVLSDSYRSEYLPDKASREVLLVSGGVSRETLHSPLRLFSNKPSNKRSGSVEAWEIGETSWQENGAPSTPCSPLSIGDCAVTSDQSFGEASCSILNDKLFVRVGGVTPNADGASPIAAYATELQNSFHRSKTDSLSMVPVPLHFEWGTDGTGPFSFASLVHHDCVRISNNEVALIGGGTTTFAFGESFAPSYAVEFVLEQNPALLSSENVVAGSGSKTSPIAETKHTTKATSSIPVIYVNPKDAKTVKMALNELNWLDKAFRMIKVQTDTSGPPKIALPIRRSELPILQKRLKLYAAQPSEEGKSSDWEPKVIGEGQEALPSSTATFASKKPSGRK